MARPPTEMQTYSPALTALRQEWANHPARGLTPSELASILEAVDEGDLQAQAELAEDMLERDAHLYAEFTKRQRALLAVPWEIAPPTNPSAAEVEAAETVKEWLSMIADQEDLLLNMMDGLLKGYACFEIEWQRLNNLWLPKALHHRPAGWFMTPREEQNTLRLRDNTTQGTELWPYGWIVHIHQAKSGYVTRGALARILAWPYLFKNYAVADLAELLEIYGLPLRLGKFPQGADTSQKSKLLEAVRDLGHSAAAIIPDNMLIEFVSGAASGESDPFMALIDWAERCISKAILGSTLTSDARSTGLGSNVAAVHQDSLWDLTLADARQVAQTISTQLIRPLLELNMGWTDPRRAPTWRFETDLPEDLAQYADALPKLVDIGMNIPVSWAHERLGIPQPEEGEAVLAKSAPLPNPLLPPLPARMTAAAQSRAEETPDNQLDRLAAAADRPLQAMLSQIEEWLAEAKDLPEFRDKLLRGYAHLDNARLSQVMGLAMTAAQVAGRYDIMTEAGLIRG